MDYVGVCRYCVDRLYWPGRYGLQRIVPMSVAAWVNVTDHINTIAIIAGCIGLLITGWCARGEWDKRESP